MLHLEHVIIPVAACSLLACGVVLGFEDHSLGDPNSPVKVLAEGGSPQVETGTDAGVVIAPAYDPVSPQCAGSPTDKPEVLNDQCGVFVSPNGNDQSPGTRALPMKTLNSAIMAAAARGYYRVFACTGIYDQRIEISKGGGASIAGGLFCTDGAWAAGATSSIIRPVEGDAVLKIHDITTKLVLESLHIEAVSATHQGASAIGAQLINASSVKFQKVEIVAGAGATGANGSNGQVASGGGEGGNASDGSNPAVEGPAKTCTCTLNGKSFGTTTGGAGGTDATGATDGQPDLAGGGAGANGTPCSNGAAGANGQSGSNAPVTSGAAGALVNGTWTPTCGGNGTDGTIAEGGGGGGGYQPGYAGGGGGCGGCPSTGATGGQGGGGSIGVLVIDSLFEVQETAITTGAGGTGGNGGEGLSGQMGGAGQGNPFGNGCMGGNGGKGGGGGHGGAGAGGISVGILYRGKSPVVDTLTDAKVTVGLPGNGGRQRIPGPTKWTNAPKGFSEKVHADNP